MNKLASCSGSEAAVPYRCGGEQRLPSRWGCTDAAEPYCCGREQRLPSRRLDGLMPLSHTAAVGSSDFQVAGWKYSVWCLTPKSSHQLHWFVGMELK
ncbi:MAG: hypothetical protein NC453_28540 [Muribaculum sp.]|nr:hypothetical protein [Muribaculum sp.]